MHQFFFEIEKHPDLKALCRTEKEFQKFPKAFWGSKTVKAILLGADPTNDGIKTNRGIKILDTVFDIDSEFEKYFFSPQMINLKAIDLSKDDLFIQNICRNYFIDQTSRNKRWNKIAEIWIGFLNQELKSIDPRVPVLVTAEKIMKLIVKEVPTAADLYGKPQQYLPLYSDSLERKVFPLYRHPKYFLSKSWPEYRTFIKQQLHV